MSHLNVAALVFLLPSLKLRVPRLTLDQEIHPIPVKEGISKGSAFCTVASMQVARQVISELDGQYTVPGFGSVAPVNVKVCFLSLVCVVACAHDLNRRLRKVIRKR